MPPTKQLVKMSIRHLPVKTGCPGPGYLIYACNQTCSNFHCEAEKRVDTRHSSFVRLATLGQATYTTCEFRIRDCVSLHAVLYLSCRKSNTRLGFDLLGSVLVSCNAANQTTDQNVHSACPNRKRLPRPDYLTYAATKHTLTC